MSAASRRFGMTATILSVVSLEHAKPAGERLGADLIANQPDDDSHILDIV